MTAMFHEVSLPRYIGEGSNFGPSYSTDVITMPNAAEQRNINWGYPKCKGTINITNLHNEDFQQFIAFFHCRRGKAYGFRFYDYADHSGEFEFLGFGDGGKNAFQLVKNYITPSINICQQRKITKPIAGTVHIYFKAFSSTEAAGFSWQTQADIRSEFKASIPAGSEQQLSWNVDTTTGLVTFATAPAANVAILSAYEYEVPVRFDTDEMPINWQMVDAENWGNIPIIELKY